MKTENAWEKYTKTQLEEVDALSKAYRAFLNHGKTERECVKQIVERAKEAGYKELSELIKEGKTCKPGDKVYAVNMEKAVILFQIGSEPIENGMNILGAHIDSPRLDVKQNPLYEDGDFAFLDTHYYGGIKKYQWVTIPLAIHGVVVKKNGEKVIINIGEKEDDPVFFISDLLVHLAAEQLEKKASKVIEGEALDIIIGNRPLQDVKDDEKKEKVQAFTLKLLKEQYGIEEKDFLSAELEIVPAGEAREAGLDRSMVLGYGQDDRVCAFSSLEAILEVQDLSRTGCCILVDKEEIGSVGATGMQSKFFENAVAELLALTAGSYNDLILRRCLANSRMLSSDVSSAFDPTYAASFDKKNVAYLGHGMVFNKFTGARGKSGSNDANAEYLGFIRKVMDDAGVTFQTAELGKVDLGGGGTIAYILSLYGMNVIDCGVPVLNMHAPHEATSKADLYEAKCGYKAFLKA
ncbi:aminopeptidase [Kineothrix sp. MSJ-39]|uniref:aminopeptidase n=1 Tax=Kineothrix sp. MSJ-39 TaxID=2841533 RepID=UPI001C0F5F52|nr:aminopeptidase [Kineothrix sp. MSJ-39]MBU5428625.1 aminopeptidase [Kineothrix sp. MSJ-39]